MSHAFAILRHALAMLVFEPIRTLRVITPGLFLIVLSVVLAFLTLPSSATGRGKDWA